MTTINWTGYDPMDRFERSMNQTFDRYGDHGQVVHRGPRSSRGNSQLTNMGSINPAVDVYETAKGWDIHVELPGVQKEDIKITASDKAITLSAESKFSQEYNHDNVRCQERRFGTFSRTIPLPDSVDCEKVSASFKDGVLGLFLPKGDVTEPRKINIS
ncbi:hypothetical protein BGW38_008387 [Lunasporangiospora selenospora]|uniref:HSP20 family protein n=1 Tax=Lunasporangiospora selenospora TaxID=979761 RepID=A0A9P6FZ34_9FUNG|nr:hypothetical protein BGW38_008387 [Lunasporangiospora selenospora]